MSSGQAEPDYPAILSSAAHDLRSPLSTIYGFARTIERIAPPPGPGAGFLAHILDAAQDMDRLLGHLSLLARIGDGRFAPVPAPVAAAELATRAAEGGAGERGRTPTPRRCRPRRRGGRGDRAARDLHPAPRPGARHADASAPTGRPSS